MFAITVFALASVAARAEDANLVSIETSLGSVKVELFLDAAPLTVENFVAYVDADFFDGTICHRVIQDFVIQCGGFTPEMNKKETRPPIQNEADNGLLNLRGTLAMARGNAVHSATAQFYINLKDNAHLDHAGRDFGYAVFGKVVDGMDVVDAIAAAKIGTTKGHPNVPIEPIVLKRVSRGDAP